MQLLKRRQLRVPPLFAAFSASYLGLLGCASPGPPRPPSLQIPGPAQDLTAVRSGDAVTLRFTLPTHTTDGQLLKAAAVAADLCRQATASGSCEPIYLGQTLPVYAPGEASPPVVWTDTLPPALRTGTPRPMTYRVELRDATGRSGGPSDPVYTAAGTAPPPVQHLQAEGTRLGVALHWTPAAEGGEVLLQRSLSKAAGAGTAAGDAANTADRTQAADAGVEGSRAPEKMKKSKKAKGLGGHTRETRTGSHPRSAPDGPLVLEAAPDDKCAAATIDKEVVAGSTYLYTAYRRQLIKAGGRTLELQSAPSHAVAVTWRDIYPPRTPTGLAALGYRATPGSQTTGNETPGAFAVDLVWQPVNDLRLAGYVVYRQALDSGGLPSGTRVRLTPGPVATPGFHDSTATPGQPYRYGVTAIDPKGNESRPAETTLDATGGSAQ